MTSFLPTFTHHDRDRLLTALHFWSALGAGAEFAALELVHHLARGHGLTGVAALELAAKSVTVNPA